MQLERKSSNANDKCDCGVQVSEAPINTDSTDSRRAQRSNESVLDRPSRANALRHGNCSDTEQNHCACRQSLFDAETVYPKAPNDIFRQCGADSCGYEA